MQQVKLAVRWDDCQHLGDLARKAETVYDQGGLNALWKHLRAFLPKHIKRRNQLYYCDPHGLLGHFEQLEAGQSVAFETLSEACTDRQRNEWESQPPQRSFQLAELPTRHEVEALCRQQAVGKAPGPDEVPGGLLHFGAPVLSAPLHRLLWKSFLSSTEPLLLYKGGRMVGLRKKGRFDDPASFRGILLASSFGKILHAWCRQRLQIPATLTCGPEQMGGFKKQQTATAHHCLRLHTTLAAQKKLSSAVLFVDIKGAFHGLLRELVFCHSNDFSPEDLETFLGGADFDIDELFQHLESQRMSNPCSLRRTQVAIA